LIDVVIIVLQEMLYWSFLRLETKADTALYVPNVAASMVGLSGNAEMARTGQADTVPVSQSKQC
jgi:hypothetical protein